MRPEHGFSLLEFVLGLTILAIVLGGATLFFASQPRQLDPVFQFRAVSLAEGLVEQVLAVKYDGQNNPNMQQRCDITPGFDCTVEAEFGTEEEADKGLITRFDDVDDFSDWCDGGALDGEQLATQLGLSQAALYRRFTVESCVTPSTDAKGQPFKEVTIGISIARGSTLSFTLHRYNLR
ncbi:prepilin-type N-terminal cleavage/methylation domain-containing protein [Zobellella aerophila]|uniref:Uncharacterized protein n=1 Tax=Zobellella aerophila TaxID=870480 RepID=A0ABP6V808_9GAMM